MFLTPSHRTGLSGKPPDSTAELFPRQQALSTRQEKGREMTLVLYVGNSRGGSGAHRHMHRIYIIHILVRLMALVGNWRYSQQL